MKVQDQMFSLRNSTKHIKNNLCHSSNFSKRLKRRILSSQHHRDTKTRKRHYQKRKLQANTFDEYRCKNPQQNISKLNATIYKKDPTLWLGWIHPRVTRIVHHMQVHQYKQIKNNENHMITLINSGTVFDKIQHRLMIKTLTKVGTEGTYFNILKAVCDKPT